MGETLSTSMSTLGEQLGDCFDSQEETAEIWDEGDDHLKAGSSDKERAPLCADPGSSSKSSPSLQSSGPPLSVDIDRCHGGNDLGPDVIRRSESKVKLVSCNLKSSAKMGSDERRFVHMLNVKKREYDFINVDEDEVGKAWKEHVRVYYSKLLQAQTSLPLLYICSKYLSYDEVQEYEDDGIFDTFLEEHDRLESHEEPIVVLAETKTSEQANALTAEIQRVRERAAEPSQAEGTQPKVSLLPPGASKPNTGNGSVWSFEPVLEWIDMEDPMIGYYAHLIQGVYRVHKARNACKEKIHEVYSKSLDPTYNCYYYYNSLTGESSWEKPKLLGCDDLPECMT